MTERLFGTEARRLAEVVDRVAAALSRLCIDGCEAGGDEQEMRACVDPPCRCREAARAALHEAGRRAIEGTIYYAVDGVAIKISAIPPLAKPSEAAA